MRTALYIAAAAALMIATPASAGSVQSTELSAQAGVYISPGGVGVRVGERDRGYDRDRRRHRGWRDREVRGDRRDGCRTVTVRETLPDGTRVSRTRTRC